MSNIGSNAGSGLRGGVHSVHGAGEAIRGQINAFADSAVGSNDSAAQNQAVSDRGVNEFQTGSSAHHNPGSSFDAHPSDVRAAGVRGNPAADNWTSSNTTSSGGARAGPYGGEPGQPGHLSSTNAGPHASNISNKADPRIDSDLDYGVTGSGDVPQSTSTSGGYGHHSSTHDGLTGSTTYAPTGAYGNPSSSNAGPHGSNVLNKADPRIDSDRDNRGLTGNQTGAVGGPHKSNVLNKADPRVDSDFDNRGAHPTGHTDGAHTGTTGPSKAGQTSGDPTGISRPSNAGLPTREDDRGNLREKRAGGDISSTNAGPHDSNVSNKIDPRIDSDRDNRGLTGNTTGAAAGPHSSGAANKADPRVDSDRDNRGLTGNTTGAAAGPHSSGAANKADPRVDSDRDNRAAGHHGVGTGVTPGSYGSEGLETGQTQHRPDSGHAHGEHGEHDEQNTTHVKEGSHPLHKSNLLNKLDPRVKTTSS